MTDGIVPIADDERRGADREGAELMAEQKIDAIFMEGTASCFYFANMRWGQSERTFGVVIPAKGELAYVCPKFEEDRARELIKFGNDVRTWEEHESPYALIAGIVKDRGVQHRRIGMEERVRFFIADGVRKAAAGLRHRGRDAGHRRLPHLQVEDGDRADAARQRRDDRRLPRGVHDDEGRHDAGRTVGEHRRRVPRARASPAAPACRSASGPRCRTAASRRRRSRKATS